MLTQLIERRGTFGQAEFYLQSRGASIEPLVEAHERIEEALRRVHAAVPPEQRRASLDRDDLDRFLFAEDDLIVVVGQDGLVANVAKYLRGQPVVGVNPDPTAYDGVLCRHRVEAFQAALHWTATGKGGFSIEPRVMAEALREDGQRLVALNEVFVGHRTHQSARYRIHAADLSTRHSSSGIICTTGTGSTGWARSIASQRQLERELPAPGDAALAWLVREPFPSVTTTTDLDFGVITPDAPLRVESDMSENGVVFADGIESDYLEFVSGHTVEIRVAETRLSLVTPRGDARVRQARSEG
ncbi:MAG: NAD(+)/NADH kinase [Pyrinomonadaceae bacterium]|nr:NAD(+)/NADH kinase [Phycisphaerales bacterium]